MSGQPVHREPVRRTTAALVAVLFAALAAVTGCGRDPAPAAPVSPSPTKWPAGIAGGACQLLDYDVVAKALGTMFDVSAAGEENETNTCVLQQQGTSYPDLTLAVSPTEADITVFKSVVVPKGAAMVPSLGKYGYSIAVPPRAGGGPASEVGWLSGNGRLLVLRYRFPAGTPTSQVTALTPKLVELSRQIDLSSV